MTLSAESAFAVSMRMLVFAVCGLFRQALRHLEAVETGHHHVEQHEIGSQGSCSGERFLAVTGHRDLVSGRAEVDLDEASDVGVVVDDEDRLSHLAASPFAIAEDASVRPGRRP